MKNTLFRAKELNGHTWIYGTLNFQRHHLFFKRYYINETVTNNVIFNVRINKHTIGKFANIYDVHGKKVFEGDIVKYFHIKTQTWRISTVVFSHNTFLLKNNGTLIEFENACDLQIVGNIYDNVELSNDTSIVLQNN